MAPARTDDPARLLRLCMQDRDAVERLLELARAPRITRAQACRRAIERIERDRR